MAVNERIKKDVVDNLYWDSRVDAADVNVDVDDGGRVTLKGTVPSYTARTAATSSTWSVLGVTNVDNELIVRYPTAVSMPSDQDIKENVERSLLWDSDIDSSAIDVAVANNEVTLKGTVDAYWKRHRAENLADTAGVCKIINEIAVVPSGEETDEDIAEDVVNALTRNINVNEEDIEVEVDNGRVTLRGEVSSWTEYRAAEETTYFTAGVKEVDNLIEIRY